MTHRSHLSRQLLIRRLQFCTAALLFIQSQPGLRTPRQLAGKHRQLNLTCFRFALLAFLAPLILDAIPIGTVESNKGFLSASREKASCGGGRSIDIVLDSWGICDEEDVDLASLEDLRRAKAGA